MLVDLEWGIGTTFFLIKCLKVSETSDNFMCRTVLVSVVLC